MTGRVVKRCSTFGFIAGMDGRSFFFHDDDLVGDVDVEEGDRVTFDELLPAPAKGPRATGVARDFSK